jgi:hypothetical protein
MVEMGKAIDRPRDYLTNRRRLLRQIHKRQTAMNLCEQSRPKTAPAARAFFGYGSRMSISDKDRPRSQAA